MLVSVGKSLCSCVVGVMVGLLVVAGAASAEDATTVGSTAELVEALRAAGGGAGGQTILLAPGEYGRVGLKQIKPEKTVIICAADRSKPPVIESMRVRDCARLTFDGLSFTRGAKTADDGYYALVDIGPSDHVTFVHCRFAGSTISEGDKAGYGSGFGIKTRGKTIGLTVRRCVITNLNKGISTALVESMLIQQNVVHDYRSDAFYVGGKNVVIEDNLILDPKPFTLPKGKGDHPDFIQGYALEDAVIRDNFFRGGHSQGVFIHGSAPRTEASPNIGKVQVVNNIIYTYMRNALIVDRLPHSRVEYNVVLEHSDKMPYRVGVISVNGKAGDETVVAYNIAENVTESNADSTDKSVTYRHNVKVQRTDVQGANYYGKVFVNALANEKAIIRGFALKLDTFADQQIKPGVDLNKFDWLKMTDLNKPDHEAHPLWLQLDEAARKKVMQVIGKAGKATIPAEPRR